MIKKVKIIVLDANILLRAVLEIRTFSLIAEHTDKILFFTSEVCYREVAFHIPNIARKRHLSRFQEQAALLAKTLANNKTAIIINICSVGNI